MIVMQYRFTLPASYDMSIIEQRISANGAKMEGFPGLVFKAFLYARIDAAELAADENRYAPLYLWRDAASMQAFLGSASFRALTQEFGWPTINVWLLTGAVDSTGFNNACYAAVTLDTIAPHADLNQLEAGSDLCAWDVSRWQRLSVNFTQTPVPAAGTIVYRIGYMASGSATPFPQ